MRRRLLFACCLLAATAPATGQGLADYDYENLSFRGIGADYGYIWPSKVAPTPLYSVRFDLGFLGPGVRIAPTVSYWASDFKDAELERLANRLEQLPVLQQQGVTISGEDLGAVRWSDLAVGVDAHLVWTAPLRLLTFIGGSIGVHALNGRGDAVADTFVEDLLDSTTAGGALLAGFEYQVATRLRFYGEARYTVMSDVRYPGVRFGAALMLPPSQRAAAEARGSR